MASCFINFYSFLHLLLYFKQKKKNENSERCAYFEQNNCYFFQTDIMSHLAKVRININIFLTNSDFSFLFV